MAHKTDAQRAEELGMTLDRFYELVGTDPLEVHPEYIADGGVIAPNDKKGKKKKEKEEAASYSLRDEFSGIGDGDLLPFKTNEDINQKREFELEHYWTRPVVSPEDEALYYGFHVHSKDNMYGLHAHFPGGPLGGGHLHGAQNRLGYHTHRYNAEQLTQFKFQRPGVMIQLDGPHVHQQNAPDGMHTHNTGNFGPAIEPEHDAHMKEIEEDGGIN